MLKLSTTKKQCKNLSNLSNFLTFIKIVRKIKNVNKQLRVKINTLYFTGGNTELRGFDQRFSRDLRELMPGHSPIINVRKIQNK